MSPDAVSPYAWLMGNPLAHATNAPDPLFWLEQILPPGKVSTPAKEGSATRIAPHVSFARVMFTEISPTKGIAYGEFLQDDRSSGSSMTPLANLASLLLET